MQTCAICGKQLPDDRKAFGRHLWNEHHTRPNDYRVEHLGLAPECRRPGCTNPVPRAAGGGWFKCCSPACAIEMKEDIPLVPGGGFGLPGRGGSGAGDLRALLEGHMAGGLAGASGTRGAPRAPAERSPSELDELPPVLKYLVILLGFWAGLAAGVLTGSHAASAWGFVTVLAVAGGLVAGLLAWSLTVGIVGWVVVRLHRFLGRHKLLLVLLLLGGAFAVWKLVLHGTS